MLVRRSTLLICASLLVLVAAAPAALAGPRIELKDAVFTERDGSIVKLVCRSSAAFCDVTLRVELRLPGRKPRYRTLSTRTVRLVPGQLRTVQLASGFLRLTGDELGRVRASMRAGSKRVTAVRRAGADWADGQNMLFDDVDSRPGRRTIRIRTMAGSGCKIRVTLAHLSEGPVEVVAELGRAAGAGVTGQVCSQALRYPCVTIKLARPLGRRSVWSAAGFSPSRLSGRPPEKGVIRRGGEMPWSKCPLLEPGGFVDV